MNRKEKKRQGFLKHEHEKAVALYLAKQEREQTGGSPKWNRAVGTDAEEVIWLDEMQPEN